MNQPELEIFIAENFSSLADFSHFLLPFFFHFCFLSVFGSIPYFPLFLPQPKPSYPFLLSPFFFLSFLLFFSSVATPLPLSCSPFSRHLPSHSPRSSLPSFSFPLFPSFFPRSSFSSFFLLPFLLLFLFSPFLPFLFLSLLFLSFSLCSDAPPLSQFLFLFFFVEMIGNFIIKRTIIHVQATARSNCSKVFSEH